MSHYEGTALASLSPRYSYIPPYYPYATQLSQQSNWFGTLRGRIGILATPSLLLYGTGGLAYGETTTSFNTTCLGYPVTGCPSYSVCATASNSSNRAGWAGGGGVEWMFAPRWTLRAEYLFVDLGSQAVTALPDTLHGSLYVNSFTAASSFHENIVRAAVNIGF